MHLYVFVLIYTICFIFHPVQADIDCDDKFQCSNKTTRDETVYLNGYKSAYGLYGDGSAIASPSPFPSEGVIYAYGAYSAQYASHMIAHDSIRCYGLHSCSFVSNFSVLYQTIWCGAGLSCADSNMYLIPGTPTESYIECAGIQSCKNSHIFGTERLYAGGSFALQNAVIETNSSFYTSVSLYIEGYYAGYNTTFICNEGVSCYCYCHGTSCYDINVICNDCNDVMFSCDGKTPSEEECKPYNGDTIKKIEDAKDLIISMSEQAEVNERICNQDSTSVVFDSAYENDAGNVEIETIHNNTHHDQGNVCCRGYASCRNNEYIKNNIPNGDIICSGTYGCQWDAGEGNSWIETNQEISIQDSNNNKYNNNNGSIFCNGVRSCQGANLRASINGMVYCGAISACTDATIAYPTKRAFCMGRYSNSDCNGTRLNGISEVYLNGIQKTSIYSNGTGMMDVFILGTSYFSPLGHIYCDRPNDTCNIYCYKYASCWNSGPTIDCSNGAVCNIYCDEANDILCGNYSNHSSNIYIFNISSVQPTTGPTLIPSLNPSLMPSLIPSTIPTESQMPTGMINYNPTVLPTREPIAIASNLSTVYPTANQETTQLYNRIGINTSIEAIIEPSINTTQGNLLFCSFVLFLIAVFVRSFVVFLFFFVLYFCA